MSALTTRDVLATGLHGLVCTRHASLDECEDAAVYRDDADALIASGAVVDAATLADDDGSLAHITACLAYPLRGDFEADQVRLPHERVQHILHVLAAALSERSPR